MTRKNIVWKRAHFISKITSEDIVGKSSKLRACWTVYMDLIIRIRAIIYIDQYMRRSLSCPNKMKTVADHSVRKIRGEQLWR